MLCKLAFRVMIHTTSHMVQNTVKVSATPGLQFSNPFVEESSDIRLSNLITPLCKRAQVLHELVPVLVRMS